MKREQPTTIEVIAAKAQALADAARNHETAVVTLALRDLDKLMPYLQQEPLHHYFDEQMAEDMSDDTAALRAEIKVLQDEVKTLRRKLNPRDGTFGM